MNNFFLYVTKTQAYQQKTEKFFVSEEKKFGRIDSWSGFVIEICSEFLCTSKKQQQVML